MPTCSLCGTDNQDDNKYCSNCGTNLADPTGQLASQTVLEGRYIIVEVLGRGGMGAVYKALDQRLNNMPVAIKEMSTGAVGKRNLQASIDSFKKEATMLINLKHPALPHITDFFSLGEDRFYLVMDYIEGQTLKEIAVRRGPIPEIEVLDWLEQLGDILDYLHNQKPPVIFRDLKPSNIMLTPDGTIKLIDFGIARHFRPDSTSDTAPYGSPGYAPPEQHGKTQTDARSDIYALGATLHHLLTGIDPSKKPFFFEVPGKVVKVSPEIESAIMKSLQLKLENRPSSIKDMLAMIPGTAVPDQKRGKKAPASAQDLVPAGAGIQYDDRTGTLYLAGDIQPTLSQTMQETQELGQWPGQAGASAPTMPSLAAGGSTLPMSGGAEAPAVKSEKKSNKAALISACLIGLAIIALAVNFAFEKHAAANAKLYQEKVADAIKFSGSGKYDEAEKSLNEALKYQNNKLEVYQNLGRLYLKKGDPQKAIELLTGQIEKGVIKNDNAALYILGSAYFDLKDYEKAASYFQEVIQASPASAGDIYETSMRDLAVCNGRLGKYGEAESLLKTIEKSKGSADPTVSYILADLNYARKNYAESARYYEQALTGDPANIRYKLSSARLYSYLSASASSAPEKEDDLKRAVAILKEGEDIDPYNIQLLTDFGKYNFDLGELYRSTGSSASTGYYQQALVIFNKLKDLGIKTANTYLNIAIVQDKLGGYAEAENAFQQALNIDEGDSHTNFVYGLYNLNRRDYVKAGKYLQRTVDLNKNPEEVTYASGKIRELKEKGWI
ncbi:protein kinase domain-containing protein [Pelotomaculum propionicicum]|uniref:protein kinase domain-containing protein n=1 Tax=Pelotomaculum propionicicum TaxID=258475 RepID=UPI003B797DDF